MIDAIRARRAALAAQAAQAEAEYAQIAALLAGLQRSIDAMHGGIQELDALLATIDQEEEEGDRICIPSTSSAR